MCITLPTFGEDTIRILTKISISDQIKSLLYSFSQERASLG